MENTKSPSIETENFDSEDVPNSKRRRKFRIRKCHFQWTPNLARRLIAYVKSFENLWNPLHFSYKDRVVHRNSWQSIAEALSLPKQEVIVKWNSLRSNYRIYLKGQLERSKNGLSAKPRRPNPYFMALAFLRRVLQFDDGKNSESDSTKIENSKKKKKLLGRSRSSSVLTDVDNVVLDIISSNKDSSSTIEIKDELSSLESEEILPSEGQFEDDSQQESRLPKSICEKRKHGELEGDDEEENQVDRDSRKRKVQDWRDNHKWEEQDDDDDDEDLNALKKAKLRLEIYNLQLDAMRKEIDLGLTRSELTAGLHKTWLLVPLKKET